MEIVHLHLARIDAFNAIPVHGFVIKHPRAGAVHFCHDTRVVGAAL